MKAPTRLPIILFCSVGSVALLYAGLTIYAHSADAPAVPVPINTIIIVVLAGAMVVFSVWWLAAHYTDKVIQAQRPARGVAPVVAAPVHHVTVQRPPRADWAADESTKKIDRRPPRRPRRAKPAPTPPSQVPGLDAEVIELGRKISGRLDRNGA